MRRPKRIPGITLGILFLCLTLSSHARELAWDLFKECNWSACSVEAQRTRLTEPTNESARFLVDACSLRQYKHPAAISDLADLIHQTSSPEIRARAALELSRLQFLDGHIQDAWNYATDAFVIATDRDIFLQSLALMRQAYRNSGATLNMTPALEMQYLTCERLLRGVPESIQPSRPDSLARRIGRTPARLIVGFYRNCIRPALGDRCILAPSCSEYFLQATHRHGLLGIPMIADRLVREPSVALSARHPVLKDQHTAYLDPVEDHDFWMEHP